MTVISERKLELEICGFPAVEIFNFSQWSILSNVPRCFISKKALTTSTCVGDGVAELE